MGPLSGARGEGITAPTWCRLHRRGPSSRTCCRHCSTGSSRRGSRRRSRSHRGGGGGPRARGGRNNLFGLNARNPHTVADRPARSSVSHRSRLFLPNDVLQRGSPGCAVRAGPTTRAGAPTRCSPARASRRAGPSPGCRGAEPGGCRLPSVVLQNGAVTVTVKPSEGIEFPPPGQPGARHGALGHFGCATAAGSSRRRLVAAIDELTAAFHQATRPTRISAPSSPPAPRLHRPPVAADRRPEVRRHAGGARILLKREDLNHTGSHKINNVLGQALLGRKRTGKTR